MKLEVRKANLEDLPVLLKFEQGLIEAERPMDPTIKSGEISYYDVSEFIRNEDSEVYVVTEDGIIVASGCVRIRGDRHYLKHDRIGYLGFMFVPPAQRGRGLNKLIIKALLDWCRDKGLYEVRLDVYNSNIAAIRAYEKAGFVKHLINMRLNLQDKSSN